MTVEAVTRPWDTERGIASREIRLRMNHLRHKSRLRPLHLANERPQEMQSELHADRGANTPTSVGPPIPFARPNTGDRPKLTERRLQANEFGSDADVAGLRNVNARNEVAGMSPMLLQISAPLAIEEASGPCELLAGRGRPDRGRQGQSERPLELVALHRTKPRPDEVSDTRDVRSRSRFPPIQILFAFLDRRTLEATNTNDALELEEHLRHVMRIRLVDSRLDSAPGAIRPSLSVEEPRCPRKIVSIHA